LILLPDAIGVRALTFLGHALYPLVARTAGLLALVTEIALFPHDDLRTIPARTIPIT
jgi:hypothetical protein